MKRLIFYSRLGFTLFMCAALCFFGYEAIEKKPETVEAAAQNTDMKYTSNTAFEGYEQLSDPLLVLVNEWAALPEDWSVTPRMVDDEQVHILMYDALMEMFEAGAEEEIWFWVASGYRSEEEQEIILQRAVEENIKAGMEYEEALSAARRTIAMPGHSEHHTGLAVDLNDVSDDFENSKAYKWLCENAAEFGFVQRYRGDKSEITGIDNESWHYRYVGKEHAKAMQSLDMCLEEYVLYLKNSGKL